MFQSRAGFSPRRDASTAGCSADRSVSFNPVLGFLLAATGRSHRRVGDRAYVSIPCWVFSSPRPRSRPNRRSRQPNPCFNPVLGFLLAATRLIKLQILSAACFNPVLGFLLAATSKNSPPIATVSRVSIPCWVFSSPRQLVGEVFDALVFVFQSRAGFSPRRDIMGVAPHTMR